MNYLLVFVVIAVPLLLLLVPLVNAQQVNNTILHNLRHFHVLSAAEKTKGKFACLESVLNQAIITNIAKNYTMINDSASTQPYGPIYSVNQQFLNDSTAELWDCVNK